MPRVRERTGDDFADVDPFSPLFIATELPVELINAVFPYRKYLFNSLKKFFGYHIKFDDTTMLDVESGIPYATFIENYSDFCFSRFLLEERDDFKIRDFLYFTAPTLTSWFSSCRWERCAWLLQQRVCGCPWQWLFRGYTGAPSGVSRRCARS